MLNLTKRNQKHFAISRRHFRSGFERDAIMHETSNLLNLAARDGFL
jgi:hypothetical protein